MAAALLAAGCGGGGENAQTTIAPPAPTTTVELTTSTIPATTTTIPPATTTAAPATVPGELGRKATAAVSQQPDFPAGFSVVAEGDGGLNLEIQWEELKTCLGLAKVQPAGVATSPTFKRGLGTQARTTVEYTTAESQAALAAAIGGAKFSGCATSVFAADVKRSAPEGGVPGPLSIKPHIVAPLGSKSFAFRVDASVMVQDLPIPLYNDFYVIFDGTAVIRAMFLNPGSEFPQDLERSLLEKVVARA